MKVTGSSYNEVVTVKFNSNEFKNLNNGYSASKIYILHQLVNNGSRPSSTAWNINKTAYNTDLNNNIDFVGALDDDALRAAYLNCNLLVMPSSYSVSVDGRASGEGFGITYLEAALAGRASIACCHGGQTDLISDGETGWLVEPNAEALAKVLREVLENPEQLRHRGNAAIQLAKVNFGFIPFRLALENALYD
jgi:glycosyltransferase involved in cell wall biosynthesis